MDQCSGPSPVAMIEQNLRLWSRPNMLKHYMQDVISNQNNGTWGVVRGRGFRERDVVHWGGGRFEGRCCNMK